MPALMISRFEVEGVPCRMSINSSDVLIVCVNRNVHRYIYLYRTSDGFLMESIRLSTELAMLVDAVQLMNKNFIIGYSLESDPGVFLISELSADGKNFIRSFDPRACDSNQWVFWTPYYLSIDEDENIFIADSDSHQVVQMNARLTDVQILLDRDRHSVKLPWRFCYVPEKQQLIVGQGRGGSSSDIFVHNLCPLTPPSDHRKLKCELELIKSVFFENVELKKYDKLNPPLRIPDVQMIKRIRVKEDTDESPVDGVTWFENKIYAVCRGSNQVHVFPDQEPFDEFKEEEIKIEGLTQPWDMSASKVSRSMFISDQGDRCLWRIQMPGGGISRWAIEGKPFTLSITSYDALVVVVQRGDRYVLDIFDCLEVRLTQSILMSEEIREVLHAVQSSIGNIIISCSTKHIPDVYQISELSTDGSNVIRNFSPGSFGLPNIDNWKPGYISIGVDGHLIVSDWRHDRVYLLSSHFTDLQIFVYENQQLLYGSRRLCYVPEKQQLIVGQTGPIGGPGLVSLFNVRPRKQSMNINPESEPNVQQ
jgi:hypothetical protein